MKILVILFVILIIAVIAFVAIPSKDSEEGYIGNLVNTKLTADKDIAKIKCIELCKQEQVNISQIEFDQGPCLSDQIIPDWVCDVAHNPRQKTDDDPANQCPEFKNKQASHFIEVDTNCSFIKAY